MKTNLQTKGRPTLCWGDIMLIDQQKRKIWENFCLVAAQLMEIKSECNLFVIKNEEKRGEK